ncbi:MAG: CHC2 zinc finger domain-containing protein [Bryobacteraceae bacterium]
MTAADLARALGGRRSGDGWMARCPAHDDRNPSLSVNERGGRVLVHCFAGCSQEAVIAELKRRGWWESEQPKASARAGKPDIGPPVAEYVYTDEHGAPLYRITRHHYFDVDGKRQKTFKAWRPDGAGGWKPGARGVRLVPYRLREVIEAPIVFIVEGEKDVETLREWGFVATCNPFGAGKWLPEFAQYFRGRTVILIPDTDAAGQRHAEDISRNLEPVAAQIILVDLRPDGRKDITEWFERGHSEVELVTVIESAWRVEA